MAGTWPIVLGALGLGLGLGLTDRPRGRQVSPTRFSPRPFPLPPRLTPRGRASTSTSTPAVTLPVTVPSDLPESPERYANVMPPPTNATTFYPPNLARWQPLVRSIIASSYPRLAASAGSEPFAMEWMNMESAGNPCAIGNPGKVVAANGQPAEIGLGQLYNPDDFVHFKQDPRAFRAYAPDAAPLAAAYSIAKKLGDKNRMAQIARQMQTATRELTDSEKDAQVRWTLLAKIDQGITNADHVVAQYSLAHWSMPDYWKLVKAPHAYPPILNSGMPAVVQKLGRSPTSWAEFRTALGMDMPNAQALCNQGDQKACVHATWMRALDACERCGNATAMAVA